MNKYKLKEALHKYGFNEIDHLDKEELLKLLHCHLNGGSIFGKTLDIIKRVKGFLTGSRKHAPPIVREFIKDHGQDKIVAMSICRKPVQKFVTKVLNALSLGNLFENLKKYNYDDLFHLYMVLVVEDSKKKQKVIVLEKNHVVNIQIFDKSSYNGECMPVDVRKAGVNLTVSYLLTKAEQYQPNDFWIWTSINNCQRFVESILKANNLYNPRLESFVSQCVRCVIGPDLRSFSDRIVDLAARGDILIHGSALLF